MTTSGTTEPKSTTTSGPQQEPELDTAHRGSLIVVGTGIKTTGQLTIEALAWMRQAQSLVYVVGDPIAQAVINAIKPDAEDLSIYYQEGQQRIYAYEAMIKHIIGNVHSGKLTVGAFYGHPGVFAYPSHESIRRLRADGYKAKMLPGISAEDCMFADLGIDPAVGGMQTYEATDFLINGPIIDNSTQLVIWQIGTLGDLTYHRNKYDTSAMPLLVERLAYFYPRSHLITVYEAPMFPGVEPMIARIPLYSLSEFPITAAMTLYIPPARLRSPDPELARRFYRMY
jgi:uncharacterized protein YabN with tetrapyrrole methylase and pyrophosphatase domain